MASFPQNRFDLIVFDWDGTIADSTPLIAECVQQAARDLGLAVPTTRDAKRVIGIGVEAALQQLVPNLDRTLQTQFAARIRAHLVAREHEAMLYGGIPALIGSLAQPSRFLAVATGKPRASLERAFAASGLKSYFHFSRCGDEGFPKPHPDMLLKLMTFCCVEPSRTLMIGDTTHDLDLADAAGVAAVAVSYGAHSCEFLQTRPSRAIVHSVEELQSWLSIHA